MRDTILSTLRLMMVGLFGLVVLWGAPAGAQGGTLRGVIVDSAGTPIRDADVGIVALRKLTKTDESGRFVFLRLPAGEIELSVRRLSYAPKNVRLALRETISDSVHIELATNAVLLATMNVTAGEMRRREGIEDFHRRRTRGVGTFISLADLEKRHGGNTSDQLRNVPGIRVIRVGVGKGVRFPTTSLARRDCAPMIWLDGQRAPGLEIDDVPLADIEGIELYHGPSTTPLQFSQGGSSANCGTIVIWSRSPTPRR